jgi:NADPH:quinone reductase-like Zn-dependent oxidoreductase
MRAIQYREFGGPEVFGVAEVADPEAGPGQIRVAVRAAGVNPVDWKLASGMMGGELPRGAGMEVAGVVDALGEGVSGVSAGDRVFGSAADGAGIAELSLVEHWAAIPSQLDFAGAAGLTVAVETAVRTLDHLGVVEEMTLLINGAAGAVGLAAVQLAVSRGARVIGTASEPNHDRLREFGAEPTTYGEGLVERVRAMTHGAGVDRALDAAGGGGALPALVELAGGPEHVVTIHDMPGAQATGVAFSGGSSGVRAWHALGEVAEMIEAGRFSLPVAETFPIEQVGDAMRLSQTGHARGKIIVTVG